METYQRAFLSFLTMEVWAFVPIDDNGTLFNDISCPDDNGTSDGKYSRLGMYNRPYEKKEIL